MIKRMWKKYKWLVVSLWILEKVIIVMSMYGLFDWLM